MACDVNLAGFAQVYKLASTDSSFVSLYTDTSSIPFDFVVSNNTLYFANGITAKKWDPTNGVTNWGIAIGSVSNAVGPNGVGTGADVAATGSSGAWLNPGNITAQDAAYSTITLTPGGSVTSSGPLSPGTATGAGWTNINNIKASDGTYATRVVAPLANAPTVQATNFGFAIPSTATIVGVQASIIHGQIAGGGSLVDGTVQLIKGGVGSGSNKATGAAWGTPPETFTYGGSSDLWGNTLGPSDVNAANFGIQLVAQNTDSISNATAGLDYFSLKVYYTLPTGTIVSDYLQGTNCGFAIPATETIQGILVEVKGFQTQTASSYLSATMLKMGSRIGTTKTGTLLPSSNGFVSFGGNGDLWGTTWTYNDINQTTFGISLQAVNGAGSSVSWSVDYVRITIYGLGGPTVTLVAGTITATTGFYYVFTYGNSNTGHISSPSPASALIKPVAQGVQVALTQSTDPQVNQIHVYRTTDGGAGSYFEIPTSPYANSTANITDNANDTALNISSIAPTATFNDPPTPFQGMVYFSGRIWGFAGNKVYFSGLEEIIQGVPEESFPSGLAGNFWAFDEPVQGLAVAGTGNNQTLAIFCGGRIYGITGNTLDTFRRFSISQRRGCRNRVCIATLGGMVAWYDSANQIWASDGNTLNELSTDIRPDLIGLNPTNCSMTFHVSGRYHWLVFSTGANLYVYDMDMEQWMPPWTPDFTYVFSGETSPGNYVLMASTGKKAIQLGSNYNDNGVTYAPVIKTGLLSVVPDFGSRFSYMAAGLYDEPTRTGVPWLFQVTNNNNVIADFLYIADDDPTKGTYASIVANLQGPETAYNRANGTYITQSVFPVTAPSARWIGMQLKLANADTADKIYELFFNYKGLGGR